jgi:hypothetical protein
MLGALTITRPTAKQAANLVGACEASIREARRKFEATTIPSSPIETLWAGMSAAERDGFVREHLPEMWTVFDRVTA